MTLATIWSFIFELWTFPTSLLRSGLKVPDRLYKRSWAFLFEDGLKTVKTEHAYGLGRQVASKVHA